MGEFRHTEGPQDTVFDVDAERLARVYAQSALDAAGGLAAQETLVSELNSLVENVLDREPRLERLFDSRLISEEDKLGMLDRLFGGSSSPSLLNTLKVMARHGRLGNIRDMVRSASQMFQTRAGRVPVTLETANPLSPALEQELLTALQRVLGADPIVSASVNPELIAGFIIRVGDRVHDASVRASLERTRQGMVARAIEAIQMRPERFVSGEA